MGWGDGRTGSEERRRCRRLASLSGLTDKHRWTHIPIWLPTDRDGRDMAMAVSVPVLTDD